MSRPVIAKRYLPTRPTLGIRSGLIFWLSLDHFHAPGWIYGVVGCLWLLLLVVTWVVISTEDDVAPWEIRK